MQHIYLVHGYGVPKEMAKNDNYRFYLHGAFNAIYDISVKEGTEAVIIFAGGKTDMFPPYERDEATEMLGYFKTLAQRSFVTKVTKNWKYEKEPLSLSTLENQLFSKAIIDDEYPEVKRVTLIFEYIREKRIRKITKKIFEEKELSFIPIDFSISETRYDLSLIKEKEEWALKVDLWALKDYNNMRKHHDVYESKIRRFRAAGPENQEQAIKKWHRDVVAMLEKAGDFK